MAKQSIDIWDLLVWAYRDQAVDEAPARIIGPHVALMRWDVAIDGTEVDVEPHPDACLTHVAVRKLSRIQAAIVIQSAKSGNIPEWYPGARVAYICKENKHGNPARMYDGSGNLIGHWIRQAIVLEDGTVFPDDQMECIDASRSIFMIWHEALCSLVYYLKGHLDEHAVTGPSIPCCPWENDRPSADAA